MAGGVKNQGLVIVPITLTSPESNSLCEHILILQLQLFSPSNLHSIMLVKGKTVRLIYSKDVLYFTYLKTHANHSHLIAKMGLELSLVRMAAVDRLKK